MLAVGKARLRSNITWAERTISFAVLHLGDHSLFCGVREFMGDAAFVALYQKITEAFSRNDMPEVIHLIDRYFEVHNYSLWSLFRDEQRKIFSHILDSTPQNIEASFHQKAMQEIDISPPNSLTAPVEYTLKAKLREVLRVRFRICRTTNNYSRDKKSL
jgi:hypothetical protein